MVTTHDAEHLAELDALTRVVASETEFKKKLGVGEEAFATVVIARRANELIGAAGAATTGAAVAGSSAVAGTFFASSGWMAMVGLGAAAVTPVGVVVGAAVLTGGAYYGVTQLIDRYRASRVDVPTLLEHQHRRSGHGCRRRLGGDQSARRGI